MGINLVKNNQQDRIFIEGEGELAPEFEIGISEKDGVRFLHFESTTQGAMRLDRPDELALEYTRIMMAALLLRNPERFPAKVLLIGLGAGSLLKFLHRYAPQAQLIVVEIDPRVVTLAKQFFELPDEDERLQIVMGDGAEYVLQSQERYDLIVVDGFNEFGHPGDLNTLPFYATCRERLSEQGILAVNLIGLCEGVKGGMVHLEDVFAERVVMFPRCKSGNSIVFAAAGASIRLPHQTLRLRAIELEARTGLSLMKTVNQLEMAGLIHEGHFHL